MRENFDQSLGETLHKNGWIRWVSVGSGNYLVVPNETERPTHKPRAKPKEGDHETRPWWTTKTTWWPNPTTLELKDFKEQYLCDKQKNFHSAYTAKRCRELFEKWLGVQSRIEETFGTGKKVRKTDPKTGRFR